jgi:hypothetical protein
LQAVNFDSLPRVYADYGANEIIFIFFRSEGFREGLGLFFCFALSCQWEKKRGDFISDFYSTLVRISFFLFTE